MYKFYNEAWVKKLRRNRPGNLQTCNQEYGSFAKPEVNILWGGHKSRGNTKIKQDLKNRIRPRPIANQIMRSQQAEVLQQKMPLNLLQTSKLHNSNNQVRSTKNLNLAAPRSHDPNSDRETNKLSLAESLQKFNDLDRHLQSDCQSCKHDLKNNEHVSQNSSELDLNQQNKEFMYNSSTDIRHHPIPDEKRAFIETEANMFKNTALLIDSCGTSNISFATKQSNLSQKDRNFRPPCQYYHECNNGEELELKVHDASQTCGEIPTETTIIKTESPTNIARVGSKGNINNTEASNNEDYIRETKSPNSLKIFACSNKYLNNNESELAQIKRPTSITKNVIKISLNVGNENKALQINKCKHPQQKANLNFVKELNVKCSKCLDGLSCVDIGDSNNRVFTKDSASSTSDEISIDKSSFKNKHIFACGSQTKIKNNELNGQSKTEESIKYPCQHVPNRPNTAKSRPKTALGISRFCESSVIKFNSADSTQCKRPTTIVNQQKTFDGKYVIFELMMVIFCVCI